MGALAVLIMATLTGTPPADAPRQSTVPPSCLRALAAMTRDSIPRPDAFERVACPADQRSDAYRYDPAKGITRLSRPIAAGEIVGVFAEFGAAMVRPGDTLELVSAAGGVRIERDVEVLQAARPGQRLFVKSADGNVLSVRYEDVAP